MTSLYNYLVIKWAQPFSLISFINMNFYGHLEMLKAGCFEPNEPLITKFLLMEDYKSKPCPRFYGNIEDKWGHLECHCHYIPKMWLSKTARNLNKVFLTCGVPYNRGEQRPKAPPCKYLQWIHTGLYPLPSEPIPEWLMKFTASRQPQGYKPRPLKSVNKSHPDQ